MAEVEIRPPRDEAEIRQLWHLNHAVFSEELRQHDIHDDGLLVDKFHAKNLYFAGWDNGEAVGMICAHWKEPFSAVDRFGEVMRNKIIPGKTAEIRLFALRPEYRKTSLAPRLGTMMFKKLEEMEFSLLIISGISTQKGFYEHIGFGAIGEPVKDGDAYFYPMAADLALILRRCALAVARCTK